MDSVATAIEAAEFEIVRRGYESTAVDAFLATIATEIGSLEEQLRHAQVKAAALEKQVAAIEEREIAAEAAYLAATDAKQKLLEEAEAQAAAILREAEKVAGRGTTGDDQIRRDAERLLVKAKEQLAAAERQRAAALEADAGSGEAANQAQKLVADAEREAGAIVAAANEEGSRIVTEARRIALETVAGSQRDAEDLLVATRREQHDVVQALQTLKKAVADMLDHGARSSDRIRVVLSDGAGTEDGEVAVEATEESAATA